MFPEASMETWHWEAPADKCRANSCQVHPTKSRSRHLGTETPLCWDYLLSCSPRSQCNVQIVKVGRTLWGHSFRLCSKAELPPDCWCLCPYSHRPSDNTSSVTNPFIQTNHLKPGFIEGCQNSIWHCKLKNWAQLLVEASQHKVTKDWILVCESWELTLFIWGSQT